MFYYSVFELILFPHLKEMEIEEIQFNDVDRIQKIAYATWPSTFKTILSTEQIEYMLSWMYNINTLTSQVKKGHHFFIYKENGYDLGFIGIEPNFDKTTCAKIQKIYILPSAQGKGVGKSLIQFAQNFTIKKYKTTSFLLNVNRFNAAVHFYHKLGFNIIKEENIDIGNDFWMEDYIMELQF